MVLRRPAHRSHSRKKGRALPWPSTKPKASDRIEWTAPTSTNLETITSQNLRYICTDAPNKADANWTVVTGIWTSGSRGYTLNPTSTPFVNGVSYDVHVRAVVGTDQEA